MSPLAHARAFASDTRARAIRWILAQRIRARHPTLFSHPTAVWDYGFADIEAIEIGRGVSVGAFAEILVYRRHPHSSVEGRLILADGAILTGGVNVRAAGGSIRIGANTGIGQHSTLVACNHTMEKDGPPYIRARLDETRTGVEVGDNVWVGANCVLLPGSRIGNDCVIAAGSVVGGVVPPKQLWGGSPARRIRDL